MRIGPVAVICAAFLLFSVPVGAQSLENTIVRGTVTDQTGRPIAGADVSVAPESGGAVRRAQTDERGAFSVAMTGGRHAVSISSPGFETATQTIATGRMVRTRSSCRSPASRMRSPSGARPTTSCRRRARRRRRRRLCATFRSRHRRHRTADPGPDDAEPRRRVPLRARGDAPPGREQPRRGRDSRQQFLVDFFVNGVRDDVQYYRDLYNLERVEALKGPNAMIFGRGGGGGVVNRVTKQAGFRQLADAVLLGGSFGNKRVAGDSTAAAIEGRLARSTACYENSDSFRDCVDLERYGVESDADIDARRADHGSTSATSSSTTTVSPTAASRRSGAAGRRPIDDILRRSRRQPRARAT